MLRLAKDKHDRGSGVGFMEMAKRSSEQLKCGKHQDFDNDYLKLYNL